MQTKDLVSTLKKFDAYPKTLEDFRVKTFGGAAVTLVSGLLMFLLFVSELSFYLSTEVTPELYVDTARGQKLRINVDVIFPKLPCVYLSIDAMDVSGEQQIDVMHSIFKKRMDLNGKPIDDDAEKGEEVSSMESENTADTAEFSQDEFDNVEVEAVEVDASSRSYNEDDSLEPYSDEPLADEEWLARYREKQEENEKLARELKKRLENRVLVEEWCTCGNCSCGLLANISECYCCKELEGCCEALTSDLVKEDQQDGQELNCITEHPGFRPVCLEKWSLRLAGGKYRTRNKQGYKKTGSEERYLRSVAYREFSRLVYGYLGKKRIPLPACAYTAIRKAFPVQENETLTGFEVEDLVD